MDNFPTCYHRIASVKEERQSGLPCWGSKPWEIVILRHGRGRKLPPPSNILSPFILSVIFLLPAYTFLCRRCIGYLSYPTFVSFPSTFTKDYILMKPGFQLFAASIYLKWRKQERRYVALSEEFYKIIRITIARYILYL